MPKRSIPLLLITFLLLFSRAWAGVGLTYSSQGADLFRIRIPDGWKVNVGIEPDTSKHNEQGWIMPRIVTAMPDDAIPLWFGIWVPPDVGSIEEAKPYMDSLAPELLKNVEVKKRSPGQLNDMESLHVSGIGYKEEERMDFDAVFVQLTPASLAIAIYIGPREATIRYGRDLREMINSLQPVQPGQEKQP